MKNSVEYKGTYTDHFGTVDIAIQNDYTNLYMEINGVQFSGQAFSDFSILEGYSYTNEQLERFTFLSTNGENTLCNCIFYLIIPQTVTDLINKIEITVDLQLTYVLGNVRSNSRGGLEEETMKLSMILNNITYQGSGNFLEDALNDIQRQFNAKFYFKNCFGCRFGDYSVFGNSSFGDMLCFVSQKENYLSAGTKQDFITLEDHAARVQEIYCCDKFESKGYVSS